MEIWGMIKTYLIAFGVFMVVEGAWLVLIAKDFYKKEIGFLMSDSPKIIPTVLFALIIVMGLVVFAINPALVKESWKYALLAGMFLGVIAYATYDLTNLATIEGWPLKVAVVDLLWGATMGGTVSTVSFFILRMLG